MNIVTTSGGIVKPPTSSASYQRLMEGIERLRAVERRLATKQRQENNPTTDPYDEWRDNELSHLTYDSVKNDEEVNPYMERT